MSVAVPDAEPDEPPPAGNHPPTPPGPLDKRVSGNRTTLSWTAASDPDPGDFVAAYRIYRDGARIAETAGLSYADDPGDRVLHRYWVTAVDARGAESAPSYEPGFTP